MRTRERLFRVIVVLGAGNAALTACAGRSTSNDRTGQRSESSGGTSSSGATGSDEPGETGAGGQLTLGVAGGPAIEIGGTTAVSAGGVGGVAGGRAGSAVGGDASAAGAEAWDGPCEHSQQYRCYSSDEGELDCTCVADAPLSENDCEGGARFICMSYEPPTGCECIWVTGPR